MMSSGKAIRLAIVGAAAALAAGCLNPHPGLAQSNVSRPDGPIECAAFERDAHGSWSVLRPQTIYPEGIAFSLHPGQAFAPNQVLDGVEISAVLDRNCGNR